MRPFFFFFVVVDLFLFYGRKRKKMRERERFILFIYIDRIIYDECLKLHFMWKRDLILNVYS